MTITILGLGPGSPAHVTREAWDLLSHAHEIYLRTTHHPTVDGLPAQLTVHSFDDLYETLEDFYAVYETIADRILALARRPQGVLYAVPGHPLVGESSVQRILARAQDENLAVKIVPGLSFLEPVLSLLRIDGLAGLQLADATDLAAAHHPALDPDRPAVVGQLYGRRLASEVKLTLMNAYPDDHPVSLVWAAGTDAEQISTVPLFELDRIEEIDYLTSLYVPPLGHVSGLPGLQETVARLRAPDGCPWDRMQTHQTLRANLLEESYEVLAALDAEDMDKLSEELGDLLMQIVLHTQIATEAGTFQFADVIGSIDAKLKRRHPHVFGTLEVQDAAEVLRNWEAIKASERAANGNVHGSRLEGVPTILPALSRAQALGDRAARDGFDWPDPKGVLDKVAEEVAELQAATDPETRSQETGDLLFTLTNLARWLGIDAESALRGTCDRFTRRYANMERWASQAQTRLGDLSPSELEVLWERAKASD